MGGDPCPAPCLPLLPCLKVIWTTSSALMPPPSQPLLATVPHLVLKQPPARERCDAGIMQWAVGSPQQAVGALYVFLAVWGAVGPRTLWPFASHLCGERVVWNGTTSSAVNLNHPVPV